MKAIRIILQIILGLIALAFAAAAVMMLPWIGLNVGSGKPQTSTAVKASAEVVPAYEMYVNNLTSAALDGLLPIPKLYWLAEDVVIAPEPDQSLFGASENPADTAQVLTDAADLLNGQDTIWKPDTDIIPGSSVRWYLDDTILNITWKQAFLNTCFTFSEVKIAHPSQFRRYFADNTFASPIQYQPSEMAKTVNAVAALSGDFYKFRPYGIVVYQRNLYRNESRYLDSCFIDGKGDFNFVYRNTFQTEAEILQYIQDNDILFSLSFGPVLIDNGEYKVPENYLVGEINDQYARCAICQLGECHYLLVTTNSEGRYGNYLRDSQVADVLMELGVKNAYTLDGGQTGAIIMNDQLINSVEFGSQRSISDIIYFATAIPEERTETE